MSNDLSSLQEKMWYADVGEWRRSNLGRCSTRSRHDDAVSLDAINDEFGNSACNFRPCGCLPNIFKNIKSTHYHISIIMYSDRM